MRLCGQTGWSDPTEGGLPCPPPPPPNRQGTQNFSARVRDILKRRPGTLDPFLGVEGFWRRSKEPVEVPRDEMPKI